MADSSRTAEKPEDFGKDAAGKVSRWLAEIRAYDKQYERWEKRCKKIVARYRAEQDATDEDKFQRVFNILWSNVQTLGPALYARTPVPDVSRRYNDRDVIGRVSSLVLERCLSYTVDSYDFDHTVKAVRDDYLLTARGQAWVRYVPHFGEETQDKVFLQTVEGDAGPQYRDDDGTAYDDVEFEDDKPFAMGEPYRPVDYEEAVCDHIAWGNFGHTPAPTWEKVTAVWKRELLTRDQLTERFGEDLGKEVRLTKKSSETITDEVAGNFGDVFKRAEVYEIWDRTTKKAIWISPGYTEGPLDEQDDPLHLNGFFPCPRPIYGTMTTDTLVPVPDYVEYQSQALEMDVLTQRIHLLLKALRVVGVYDASVTALQSLLEGEDNKMVPVDQWAMFAEKGGLVGSVSFFPVKEIAEVALALSQSREQIKQDLYEISGISDIVRGQVDPREKLGQSQLKGQFATLRLQDRQTETNRFVRDLLRLKGEIISEHFSEDTILQMSGWLETTEAQMLDKAHGEAMEKLQAMQQQVKQGMAMAAETAGVTPETMAQGLPPEAMGAATGMMQGGPQQPQQQPQQPAPQPQAPMGMPEMPEVPPSARDVFAQAVELLRQDRLRTFRVDIETDSTTFEDQQAEKQSRTEFLTATGGFIQQAMAAIQVQPQMGPLLGKLLLFGIRGFKVGREVESAFEEALEDLDNAPPQQQQGDPAAAAQAQADTMKAQTEQFKVQIQQGQAQHQAQIEQAQFAHQQMMERLQFQADEADKKHQRGMEEQRLGIERILAQAKMGDVEARAAAAGMKLVDDQAARHEQQDIDREENQADREHQSELAKVAAKRKAANESR